MSSRAPERFHIAGSAGVVGACFSWMSSLCGLTAPHSRFSNSRTVAGLSDLRTRAVLPGLTGQMTSGVPDEAGTADPLDCKLRHLITGGESCYRVRMTFG